MYENLNAGFGPYLADALTGQIGVQTTGHIYFVGNASLASYNEVSAMYGQYHDGKMVLYTTIALALAQCVASRGDVILVMPGHAETVSSATALALNVAGVTIIGMHTGSLRPTLTLDTVATSKIVVSVNNVAIRNFIFVANFADIATVFSVTGASDFWIDNCEFRDTSSVLNFLSIVTTVVSTTTDGLKFTNNRIKGLGTTAGTTPIKIANTIDRVRINDNYINLAILNNTSAVLAHAALVVTNLEMARNRVFRLNTDTSSGALLITTTSTTNSGIVCDNYAQHADVAAALLVTAGSIYGMFNNLTDGDADASGYVLPAIGAN